MSTSLKIALTLIVLGFGLMLLVEPVANSINL